MATDREATVSTDYEAMVREGSTAWLALPIERRRAAIDVIREWELYDDGTPEPTVLSADPSFARLEADDLRRHMYEIVDILWPGEREDADAPPKPEWIVETVRDRLRAVSPEPTVPSEEEKDYGVVRIVFDGPPGPESGRFVEVETVNGCGVKIGRWVKGEGDLWYLELPVPWDDCLQPALIAANMTREQREEAAQGSPICELCGHPASRCPYTSLLLGPEYCLRAAPSDGDGCGGVIDEHTTDEDMRQRGFTEPAIAEINQYREWLKTDRSRPFRGETGEPVAWGVEWLNQETEKWYKVQPFFLQKSDGEAWLKDQANGAAIYRLYELFAHPPVSPEPEGESYSIQKCGVCMKSGVRTGLRPMCEECSFTCGYGGFLPHPDSGDPEE